VSKVKRFNSPGRDRHSICRKSFLKLFVYEFTSDRYKSEAEGMEKIQNEEQGGHPGCRCFHPSNENCCSQYGKAAEMVELKCRNGHRGGGTGLKSVNLIARQLILRL
jgi:hypothetical protein